MNPFTSTPGTQSYAQTNQRLFQRVFTWMFAGLIMTAIVAIALSQDGRVASLLAQSPVIFWGVIIVELLLVITIPLFINKISATTATILFFLYAALNGVTFTLVLAFFKLGTIGSAFFIAAGMFGISAVIGYVTKRDLSKLSTILFMFLIGIILATIVNMIFLQSSGLQLIISYVVVGLFCVITAFDIQMIKQMGAQQFDGETGTKYAIFGALMLYIDFIAIFKNLIYILGSDD